MHRDYPMGVLVEISGIDGDDNGDEDVDKDAFHVSVPAWYARPSQNYNGKKRSMFSLSITGICKLLVIWK